MAITVKIPTQLREATDGEASADVEGETVGEVLDALYDRYGELRGRIAEDGGLRRFVNVYVAGEDIRFMGGPGTPVSGWVVAVLRGRAAPPPPGAQPPRGRGARSASGLASRAPPASSGCRGRMRP